MTKTMQSLKLRGKQVRVAVSDTTPYAITDSKGKFVGMSMEDGLGVYMKDVKFVVSNGQPTIAGAFLGSINNLRLNISDGVGIMFDKDRNAFTDGQKVVKQARMVQVYDGVIKAVIV